ncbi:MAG: leucine--tRNA ligase [Nitrosomonadaceae bacterium]|jgi:leucyl-tRNA synthetase|nr:leucine--tRNA ligase [Nitrosomonadaceae bacterium]
MDSVEVQKYDPKTIETAAQSAWNRADAYRVVENATDRHGKLKPKFYACSMLPYPSGKLHMGHVRNYTINDVMLRHLRMKGYNVLMPMGWDAFGLPAENAAMANGAPPAAWTYQNITEMKSQMQPLGLAFDWSREVTTCKPDYYKWNQWLFLKMLEKGIAYRKTQIVNWDPIDQTVLANEQVIDGRGWRSGALVEKKEIPGYYLGITQYAQPLLDAVKNDLTGWPSQVRTMQENWIGKSEGVRFPFLHTIRDDAGLIQDGKLFVFTTRADTTMGVTFCAVAPEHPLAQHAAKSNPAIAEFIEKAKQGGTTEAELAAKDKEGVPTGLTVTHPLTEEQIPVWIGNYVLMSYGDGAVMGVPAHDERDFAFAKKYGITIKPVIDLGKPYSTDSWQQHYGDHGVCIESGAMNGMNFEKAINYVAEQTSAIGGEKRTTWRLRDWGISRQRYWGTPIPIIHCDDCGPVPVPEKDLPVVLPEDLVPDGSGSPLKKDQRFLQCTCPQCGKPATRETDTMDTFVDSSWYFMRYCNPDNAEAMVDARNEYWMPMDQYIGGIEHAVLHLLYARFWTRVMHDLGLVSFKEPFTNLFTQGMLSAECFYREDAAGKKRWFYPSEVEIHYDDKGRPTGAIAKEDGQPVMLGGMEKMSKSKNNVVEPKDIIAKFGADTARAYVMFAGPPEQSAAWSDSGAEGVYRFLKRLYTWAISSKAASNSAPVLDPNNLSAAAKKLRFEIHSVLQQATHDYARLQYNTVVSAGMKMLNALEGSKANVGADWDAVRAEGISILLRTLYPLAPHICWHLWNDLGFAAIHGDIIDAPWPEPDPAALEQDEIELVVQVNGKLRGHICVPKDASKDAIEKLVLADAGVAKHTEGKPIKKLIVVPGRLINVVV